MEDAHVIHMSEDWAFFGVFDGHGGDQCSNFVADQISKRLITQGCPADDAAVKHLVFSVDQEFLDTKQDSGTTGTMCIVHRPRNGSNKFGIRVANVGDSRILLGRRDGSIVDGGGSDLGLTTDHKPDNPGERQRIYRCGGHVAAGQLGGPARVNGELSVSRCFGDERFKRTGGPGPEEHPVTANPEFGYFECSESDFLLLVCDGVSEGDFPNSAVVKMVGANLRVSDDTGAAAQAVCRKAIEAGSKDNVTCMLVLLTGSGMDSVERSTELVPGQLCPESLSNKAFMTAYEAMAKKAGFSLAQAAEMRYEALSESLSRNGLSLAKAKELRAEVEAIGNPAGAKGSSQRSAWFRNWEERLPENMVADESESEMMRMLMAGQGMGGSGGSVGLPPAGAASGRRIRVPELAVLKRAVTESPALEWDARMSQLVGAEGHIRETDPSDGTSLVWCPSANMTAWLPTFSLISIDGTPPTGKSRGAPPANSGRAQLPPRLDQPPRVGAGAAGRRAPPPPVGARGSSPSTPNSSGPIGASPSSSALSQSGRAFFAAPRLPAMGAGAGSTMGGNRASSPGAQAAGHRGSSPGVQATGNRNPSPSVAAAGNRSGTGRYRAASPIDFAVGNQTRAAGEAGHGRTSRSMPPRPPHV